MPSTRDMRHMRLATAFLLHWRRHDVAAANAVVDEFIGDPAGATRFLNAVCTIADFALTESHRPRRRRRDGVCRRVHRGTRTATIRLRRRMTYAPTA